MSDGLLFGTKKCQFDHRMEAVRDRCLVLGTHEMSNQHGMTMLVCANIAEDLVERGYKDPRARCTLGCGQHIRDCWTVKLRD